MHLVMDESDIKHGFKSCHESTVHSVLAYINHIPISSCIIKKFCLFLRISLVNMFTICLLVIVYLAIIYLKKCVLSYDFYTHMHQWFIYYKYIVPQMSPAAES